MASQSSYSTSIVFLFIYVFMFYIIKNVNELDNYQTSSLYCCCFYYYYFMFLPFQHEIECIMIKKRGVKEVLALNIKPLSIKHNAISKCKSIYISITNRYLYIYSTKMTALKSNQIRFLKLLVWDILGKVYEVTFRMEVLIK